MALLQFFHAFETTWIDLGAHALGFVLVAAAGSMVGRPSRLVRSCVE